MQQVVKTWFIYKDDHSLVLELWRDQMTKDGQDSNKRWRDNKPMALQVQVLIVKISIYMLHSYNITKQSWFKTYRAREMLLGNKIAPIIEPKHEIRTQKYSINVMIMTPVTYWNTKLIAGSR